MIGKADGNLTAYLQVNISDSTPQLSNGNKKQEFYNDFRRNGYYKGYQKGYRKDLPLHIAET